MSRSHYVDTARWVERGRLIEAARVWHVARQRFDAAKHSADVEVLRPLWKAVADAEERLSVAIEELDR